MEREPQPAVSELPLFRFRLRQLFGFVAVICILLAAMAAVQGASAVVLLMAALVVAAHVFGTALGSRLRAHADHHQIVEAPPRRQDGAPFVADWPRPHWHRSDRAPPGRLRSLIFIGAALGFAFGGIFLKAAVDSRTTPTGIAVGAISLGVLGGWVAFLAGSFYFVFRHGVREAMKNMDEPHAR